MAQRGKATAFVAAGFALSLAGKPVELFGDVAPEGSGERLGYHVLALVLVLLAIMMFVKGGIAAVRAITGRTETSARSLVRIFAEEPQDPSTFDPDAALSRYLQSKADDPSQSAKAPMPRPNGAGFERKRD